MIRSIAKISMVVTAFALAACSPTDETTPVEASDATEAAVDCGNYPAKECDPGAVLDYIVNNANDTLAGTLDCASCVESLVKAGVVVYESGGVALISPGSLLGAVKLYSDCQQCVSFVQDTGVLAAIDCTLEPCQYDPEVRNEECNDICQWGGSAYGYVAQVGSACICTDDPFEKYCQAGCYSDDYHINPEDCVCYPDAPPPPPEPEPECHDGNTGYSCSADPETFRDRACCNGQCVIWECSACDSNPYCGY